MTELIQCRKETKPFPNGRRIAAGIVFSLISLLSSSDVLAQAASSGNKSVPNAQAPSNNPDDSIEVNWRVGLKIKGGSETCKNLLVTIPIPGEWPEQSVRVIGKDVPPEVQKLVVRNTSPNLTQLVATIPTLRPEQELKFTYDFQVKVRKRPAPSNPSGFKVPKSLPKDMREYLEVSPGISYRDNKLRATVKDLVKPHENPWEQVQAIYEWVQKTIEPRGGDPTDSLDCFETRTGTGEDIAGLFVATCRANKVPARMVWVTEYQYAEFYLVDEAGIGSWFPVIFGGHTEFGSLSVPKLIEMKGDNFRVPEKTEPQKYVFEFLAGEATSRPKISFIRQMIPAAEIQDRKK